MSGRGLSAKRDDAICFSPHDEADPAFGQALREAARAGVEVYAHKCRVSEEEVTLDAPLLVAGLAAYGRDWGCGHHRFAWARCVVWA